MERIADLHSHALINMTYLRKDLAKKHKPPFLWNPLRNHLDLPRLEAGGVKLSTFNIYVPFKFPYKSYQEGLHRMAEIFLEFIEKNSARIGHARSFAEIEALNQKGRIAAVLAVEGGHVLEGRLENLEYLKSLGVLYLTLTHFVDNEIVGAAWGSKQGLTGFGKELVKNLPAARILPDLAHTSVKGFYEVCELCPGPVIYSHGGVRRFCDVDRDLSDDQIMLIAKSRGMIGIMLYPWYLKRFSFFGGPELISDTFKHIESLIGPDRTCLGTDLDGYIKTVRGVRDVADLPALLEQIKKDLGPERVSKLAGENLYNFLKEINF